MGHHQRHVHVHRDARLLEFQPCVLADERSGVGDRDVADQHTDLPIARCTDNLDQHVCGGEVDLDGQTATPVFLRQPRGGVVRQRLSDPLSETRDQRPASVLLKERRHDFLPPGMESAAGQPNPHPSNGTAIRAGRSFRAKLAHHPVRAVDVLGLSLPNLDFLDSFRRNLPLRVGARSAQKSLFSGAVCFQMSDFPVEEIRQCHAYGDKTGNNRQIF